MDKFRKKQKSVIFTDHCRLKIKMEPPKKILCVDLDGTFLQTDMLYESFVYCFMKNPLILFLCISWLIRGGKTLLKEKLANQYTFDPTLLPVNTSVHNLICSKKHQGYFVFLISASADKIVKTIFERYSSLFNGYFGTGTVVTWWGNKPNLQGVTKAEFIKVKFKNSQIEYIGNSKDDVNVWKNCSKGYAVSSNTNKFPSELQLEYLKPNAQKSRIKLILKQLRVHQWVKNSLIFLPLVASHQILSPTTYLYSLFGICAFSLITSTVYVINDLLDLENDRTHETKKKRPLASGDLSIILGLVLVVACFTSGSVIAYAISPLFLILALVYILINLFYSGKAKKIIILDCILLSMMYTYRIFLGTIIASLEVSVWMISFSFFLFLSLAFIKRYSELFNLKRKSIEKSKGRAYQVNDMPVIIGMAIGAGFLSILVLDIYLNQDEIKETFKSIWFAYFCLPTLLYWLARIFIKTARGNMNEDPVTYAIKDKASLVIGTLFVVFFFLAAFVRI